ncbi:Fe-S-cluster containining protein [Methanolobus vulcani]|jgi:Fe-S-cluster containining protein|uniref:Fe-S-cluster containining protein n=1 Tax=Methanolobus vulcani TaxID=38026 RepID=A0A7Z7FBF8_9EURY|nr:YkgJ family cysteine cluster protein [Methanolobus vulcani]SDF22130.1 Fe-S-cluster containining protein [Methanolobus vulcani]
MTEIDFSPLKGLRFNCLEGCGFCCSFPAEVREWEKYFSIILEKNSEAFRKWKNEYSCLNGIYTMRQRQDRGSCILLRDDKRCGIYDIRSLLCRTFPVKFFFGWRVQLYPSMSCRGFSDEAVNDMTDLGKEAIAELPEGLMDQMLEKSKALYASLPEKIHDYMTPDQLHTLLLEHVDKMLFYPWSVSDEARGEFEVELSSENFLNLPTYLTEELEWQVFRMEDGFVRRMILKETGETKNIDNIVYSNFSVKPLSSEAARDLSIYLSRLASTDHFAGVVYRKALEQGDNLISLSCLAVSELEKVKDMFLLKASLLAEFDKWEHVNERTIEDTIVMYDSCLATVPAIGMIL